MTLICSSAYAVPHTAAAEAPAQTSIPFASFIDRYLEDFGQFHPSIAAGNGLHRHDGDLEDFSAASIARELHWLHATRQTLDTFPQDALTPDERVDRRILQGIIDGWILDLNVVRSWQRNPMIYVAALSDGLHDLMTMESDSAEVRMRRALSKLAAVPALLGAARTNIRTPPRVYVESAIGMLGGVEDLLSHDLPLAFATSSDAALRERLIRAANQTRTQLLTFQRQLARILPTASGSFAIGVRSLEARYRAEELIDLPADRLLAIGERELALKEKEFRETALQIDPQRTALEVWRDVQNNHPTAGDVVPVARAIVEELFTFINAHGLMRLPAGHDIVVAAAPAYDLGLASMHSSPPLEPHPVQSYYYITDVAQGWPAERQEAWLRLLNYATLADITAHEVAPGHYVHSLYMKNTTGKIRRIWVGLNPFPQPSSGQDGWAHYAEQMVSDEGFHREDPRYRLAMLAESLTRICRLIAGIKLHSGQWSVDQAAQIFERDAHLPAPVAHREAVRGTYDPTYGGYVLGKMAALKLREDYRKVRGDAYTLRDFNEHVMTDGIAPWAAHRQLLLPNDHGQVLE